MSLHRWIQRVIALVCAWTLSAGAAWAVPSNPDAKGRLDKGLEYYEKQDYDKAVDEFKAGYEIEQDPVFLYTQAQAERLRGNCGEAIDLYDRYLETNPPAEAKNFAVSGKAECATRLREEAAAGGGDDPVDAGDDPTGEVSNDALVDTGPEPVDEPRRRPQRPWYRDPLGGTLVAIGIVGIGVGAGLFGAAFQLEKAVEDANDSEEFANRRMEADEKGPPLRIGGGVTIGVGAALLIGGAVRWGILGARQKKAAKAARATPFFTDHSAGIMVRGRF